jgi:hypothetical protein
MDTTRDQPQAQALYRSLQCEVRAAIDRCADGLDEQYLHAPATPEAPMVALSAVLRGMLIGSDFPRISNRLLLLLAESARNQDAVALFTIERIATHYAMREVESMFDAGLFGLGVSDAAA